MTNIDLRDEAPLQPKGTMENYQAAVGQWMVEVFGEEIAMDPLERVIRFLEEALELGQAEGMSKAEAQRVVDYVWGRPKGETPQEVGGVAVTLAGLCFRRGISLQDEALRELERINTPEMRKKIFDKQAFKRSQGLTSDGAFREKVVEETYRPAGAAVDADVDLSREIRETLGNLDRLIMRGQVSGLSVVVDRNDGRPKPWIPGTVVKITRTVQL